MAEQADVFLKNNLQGYSINATHMIAGGGNDPTISIPDGTEGRLYLGGIGDAISIDSPTGLDTKMFWLGIKSDLDLDITYSRTDNTWTIKIKSNELPPEVPTTVNVTIGTNEPQ